MFADCGAIENGCTHADKTFVANCAGVNDGGMADRDIVSKNAGVVVGEVEDGVVLNIAVVTDNDAIDIAAKDGIVPDAGMVTERHVTEDDGGRGDINVLANRRFFAQKSVELLFERHEKVLNQNRQNYQCVSQSWCRARSALYLSSNG